MVCRSGVDEQAVAGEMLRAAQHCPSSAHSMENVGFLTAFQRGKPFAAHVHTLCALRCVCAVYPNGRYTLA